MLGRAIAVVAAGNWPVAEQRATATLDYDHRHRRRLRLPTDSGQTFLLDLERPAHFDEGDGLALEEGGYVRVIAAAEAVADLRCATPEQTARVAWHIGNRHVPLQVLGEDWLRIREDSVIVDLVRKLGAHVICCQAPFSPESGAYTHRSTHGHGHSH